MSLSMMVPVTMPAIRHVGLNSIRRRRHWAMAVYVTAYLTVWVAFGALALLFVRASRAAGVDERQFIVFTLSLATAWQLTPSKRRAIVACRRTVALPPAGWRADLACARFGVYQAWRCIVACWPLMLLMAAIGHELGLMMVLTTIVVAEERASIRDRLRLPFAAAFAAVTVLTALRQ
jgi:predicted metal-binding membrane protein